MAKTPSKSPVEKIVPPGATQKPTPIPLPRGADPAAQANSSAKTMSQAQSQLNAEKISRPDPALVAQRAFERYQQRGGQDGGDQADWYAAEQDLSGSSGEQ